MAFLVALQDEQDEAYKRELAAKISDDKSEYWDLDDLDADFQFRK